MKTTFNNFILWLKTYNTFPNKVSRFALFWEITQLVRICKVKLVAKLVQTPVSELSGRSLTARGRYRSNILADTPSETVMQRVTPIQGTSPVLLPDLGHEGVMVRTYTG